MRFVQLLLNIEHEQSLVQEPHFSSSWVTAQVIRLQGYIQPSVKYLFHYTILILNGIV